MSQYRIHINKWKAAYLRCALYVLAAVLPDAVSELKGYKEFGDISAVNWVTLYLSLMYDAVIQIAAFMDKTTSKTEEGDTATVTGTASLAPTLPAAPSTPPQPSPNTPTP